MRWLFVFLVFLNVFFYIWQRQQLSETDTKAGLTEYNPVVKSIILLSEHPELKTKEPTETLVQQDESSIKEESKPLTCLYIGGFTNQKQLGPIKKYLDKMDSTISPITIQLPKLLLFEVYIETHDSETQQAILKKLNQLTINGLIISRGTLKDNISLGIFTQDETYTDFKNKLNDSDITTHTKKLPEAATSYWLKIAENTYSLFTQKQLADLLEKFPTAQQELMPCQLQVNNSN